VLQSDLKLQRHKHGLMAGLKKSYKKHKSVSVNKDGMMLALRFLSLSGTKTSCLDSVN
jgi:hypothetical protein